MIERAGWTRGGGTSVIPAARRAGATVRRHTTLRGTHSRTASHGTHSTPTNQRTTSADQRRFAGIATRSRRASYCVAATTQQRGEKRYIEREREKKRDSDRSTDFWITIADQTVIVKIGGRSAWLYRYPGSLSEIWLATIAVSGEQDSFALLACPRGVACALTVRCLRSSGCVRGRRASEKYSATIKGANSRLFPVLGDDCAEGQTTRHRGGGATTLGVRHPLTVGRTPREWQGTIDAKLLSRDRPSGQRESPGMRLGRWVKDLTKGRVHPRAMLQQAMLRALTISTPNGLAETFLT